MRRGFTALFFTINGASGNDHTTPQMPQSILRPGTLPFAQWSMDYRYCWWGTHASYASSCPSWSGVNRVSRSRLAGSPVAKLGDDSSATRHEWVRRDAHAAKPAGSREVTQISIAVPLARTPTRISDVTDRVLSILTVGAGLEAFGSSPVAASGWWCAAAASRCWCDDHHRCAAGRGR